VGLTEEKAALREAMRAARAAIPAGERARRSAEVERHLLSLGAIRDATTVLMFRSFGSEVETAGILRRLAEAGGTVLLPAIRDGELVAVPYRPGDRLVASGFGPLEPVAGVPVDPVLVDAVVAPGLAFDRQGYRLGYGGGYFDRFLRRLRDGAARVGIGFSIQLVEAVPHGPGDERLDAVVTELEAIDCTPA